MLSGENYLLFGITATLSTSLGYLIIIEMFPQHKWRNSFWKMLFGIGFVCSCITETIAQIFDLSTLGMILCPVFHAFIVSIFYKCKYRTAFLWMWFYCTITGILRLPLLTVWEILGREGMELYSYFPVERLVMLWDFWIVLMIAVLHKLGKRTLFQDLKCILVEQEGIVYGFSILGWSMLTVIMYIQQRYVSMGSLVLDVIVFGMLGVMFCKMGAYYMREKRLKNDFTHQQAVWIREQKTMKEWYAKDAKRLHDTKHILLYLQKCLAENEVNKAQEQLQTYTKEIVENQKRIWTGFSAIDFSVNYYHQIMQEEGIEFFVETDIRDVPIEEMDMMVLLGNLLDNAMTAAGKCPPGHREVHLKFQTVNEMFRMVIENSMNEIPKKKNGRLLTSKKEKEYHGWGIEIVKQLTEKYGGEMELRHTEERFQAEVLIYGKE